MLCRNMRELRELVCLSRLDYHEADDHRSASDSDDACLSPRLQPGFETDRRLLTRHCTSDDELRTKSSDSCTSSNTSLYNGRSNVNKSLESNRVSSGPHNLLPSLQSPIHASLRQTDARISCASSPLPAVLSRCSSHDFATMFDSIDITVVSCWLQEASSIISRMSNWSKNISNSVLFAHFWLSKLSGVDRSSLIRLEYGILVDRLSTAFPTHLAVRHNQVRALTEAVFHEYPRRMLSGSGAHLVLSLLDTLTLSQRDEEFCRLISDVHCTTHCREHTEIVLAMRAFSITTVLSAFVDFYCKLDGVETSDDKSDALADCLTDINLRTVFAQERMIFAIRNGLTDVIHYLIKSGWIQADYVDSHQRSLVFLAVIHHQPKVLQFFLTHVKCRDAIDLNRAADSGNTPLHAAANLGDVALVDILLTSHRVDVNATNQQAGGATPLHLAIMLGHREVVIRLKEAGADFSLTTDGLTALDIAHNFEHEDIIDVLSLDST